MNLSYDFGIDNFYPNMQATDDNAESDTTKVNDDAEVAGIEEEKVKKVSLKSNKYFGYLILGVVVILILHSGMIK